MHFFRYPLSWLEQWGAFRMPAWRPWVLADFGNVDNHKPYIFLEIVDGSLYVHRLKQAPSNACPRLDYIPFLGVEKLSRGSLTAGGERIYYHSFGARIPLFRLAGLLAVPLLLMTGITLARGPLCRYLRRRRGLCVRCGYDLTGNVTGACPECGSPDVANQRNADVTASDDGATYT